MKKIFFTLALFMGLTAFAQRDVTSLYITNATLSDGTNGWTKTFTKKFETTDPPADAFSKSFSGNNTTGYATEAYAGWGDLIQTAYSMKQSITLPIGHYTLVNYSFFRQGDAGTYTYHVDIRTLPLQEQIAHPSSDDIALQTHLIGRFTNQMQYLMLYFRVYNAHFPQIGRKGTKKKRDTQINLILFAIFSSLSGEGGSHCQQFGIARESDHRFSLLSRLITLPTETVYRSLGVVAVSL